MSRALADAAGNLYSHTNGTDDGDDHQTEYGAGTALVVVLFGLLMISLVFAVPYYVDDTYYAPLGRRKENVVYVSRTADAPTGMMIEAVAVRPNLAALGCDKV